MSDTQRDAHRQELRDASTHVTVALPYTDGDLTHALGQLEELLLAFIPEDADDDVDVPASLASGLAADALGRLGSWVAAWERDEPAVQPIAPDGRFELVPLLFAPLGRTDRHRISAAVAALVEVEDLVTDYTGSAQAAHELLAQAQRLVALIHLPWDDDVDRLHALLGRGATSRPTERLVLTPDELAAYQRVTERIVATWHGNDPLERFLYRGA